MSGIAGALMLTACAAMPGDETATASDAAEAAPAAEPQSRTNTAPDSATPNSTATSTGPIACIGADQARAAPPFDGLRTNAAVRDITKEQETLRLEAYIGPGGRRLIGYGHAGDVAPGAVITAAQAEALLIEDLAIREQVVKRAVTSPMTENEFSAMVKLTYNIGETAFRASTLLRKFNAGDRAGAADEFLRWNKINGEPSRGLTARRELERAVFVCPGEARFKG